jgi:hypothetical protein
MEWRRLTLWPWLLILVLHNVLVGSDTQELAANNCTRLLLLGPHLNLKTAGSDECGHDSRAPVSASTHVAHGAGEGHVLVLRATDCCGGRSRGDSSKSGLGARSFQLRVRTEVQV